MARKQLKPKQKHRSVYEQAEVLLYAAIYGDPSAIRRFGVSLRSLKRYRSLARDKESELAQTVTLYASAFPADDVRPEHFGQFLKSKSIELTDEVSEMIRNVEPGNVDAIRAVTELIQVLFSQDVAIDYVKRLFGGYDKPDDSRRRTDGAVLAEIGNARPGSRPVAEA